MRTRSARLTPTREPQALALPVLVAVSTLLTLELVRASGPLLDLALTRSGVAGAVTAALLTYLAPGLVLLVLLVVTRLLARGSTARALSAGALLLGGLRLAVQGVGGDVRFTLGLGAVAVAVAVLTLAVAVLAARPGGASVAAASVAAGAAGAVGLQLALGTWDAVWRHTPLGWGVTVALVAGLGVSALLLDPTADLQPGAPLGRLWVLGPVLALAAMMLANPAFAASQSGWSLALAGPLHAAGLLLAAWTVLHRSRRATWPGAALLVLAVAVVVGLGGAVPLDRVLVLAALLGAQLLAVRLFAAALAAPTALPQQRPTPGLPAAVPLRAAAVAALVGVGAIGPVLVHQLDYEAPLGFSNELVVVAVAAALALGGLRRAAAAAVPVPPRPSPLLAGAGALVLLGAVAAVAAWAGERSALTADAAQPSAAGRGVVMSWNLHYGVSPDGAVDLEEVARTIEAQDPDAVLLQEVSRGWVQGGGVDMATWLSRRLDRPFVFAPAADRRFGNVILARDAPRAVQIHPLPYGQGPQQRSAISAEVLVGGVRTEVTSVHLQHRPGSTPTRIQQLQTLLAALEVGRPGGPPLVVGGDLNAGPGGPEPALMTGAGFVSAVDVAGDPQALTDPSTAPTRRIDWVFGRGVRFRQAEVLSGARWSDHLPVVVRLGGGPAR